MAINNDGKTSFGINMDVTITMEDAMARDEAKIRDDYFRHREYAVWKKKYGQELGACVKRLLIYNKIEDSTEDVKTIQQIKDLLNRIHD